MADAQDGKGQIVLIAYAIAESENRSIWANFFDKLNQYFVVDNCSTLLMSEEILDCYLHQTKWQQMS